MLVLRYLTIFENFKLHPQFHEFVDYVLTGDKFRLGLDIPGFYGSKTLSDKAEEARKVLGEDFLGFTKSNALGQQRDAGINTWSVVRYLKTKL
nr:MAG: RNA-dependent RNA polymerase [Mystacina tuberculata picobirnavirus 2]